MSIGKKVKRITIEKQTATPDGHGGSVLTWSPRCVVWAHERPLSGAEALRAAQVTAVLSSVWIIWQTSETKAVSVKDRIVFESRVIQIESKYDATDTREEWTMACSEVAL